MTAEQIFSLVKAHTPALVFLYQTQTYIFLDSFVTKGILSQYNYRKEWKSVW